jgi:hypothetical protein
MARLGFDVIFAQKTLNLPHYIRGQSELRFQHPTEFFNRHLASYKFVLRQDERNTSAHSPRVPNALASTLVSRKTLTTRT